MQSIPVDVRRAESTARDAVDELEQDLRRARRLAGFLDARFEIAGVKFGFDALIGLLPVVGDIASTSIGLYLLYLAKKHRMGPVVLGRMAGNLLIDWLVGLIPVLGDFLDVFYRAHLKNLAIFEAAAARRRRA